MDTLTLEQAKSRHSNAEVVEVRFREGDLGYKQAIYVWVTEDDYNEALEVWDNEEFDLVDDDKTKAVAIYWFDPDYPRRIMAAAGLGELVELLDEFKENDPDGYMYFSGEQLPVFGADKDLPDTLGIFSWDDEDMLVQDINGDWAIESREDVMSGNCSMLGRRQG